MLQGALREPVTDPEEEAFLVFSQTLPSQSLGFIDSQASVIDITIGGRDLTIHQSRGLLTSDRKQGTTGAVVWKVTPLFAEWISSPNFLFNAGFLTSSSAVLELGAGVSGIVALTLGPKINRYIATDQDYVIRLLKQNISENWQAPSTNSCKKPKSKAKRPHAANEHAAASIETLELDWELDSVSGLPSLLQHNSGLDLVIACDCIYNDALIEPLNSTCAQLCQLRETDHPRPTLCLVAQQLRSPDVFESWLKSFHRSFHVFRVPDELLAEPLRENSGFVVHVGYLRSSI
ncbi:hypothetical protein P154DRAFT_431173 [Amniculicola lignicola CBS 123094]|uniref:Diaminohydroxyphosphoribosylamino-pyrimidine deaminase n=1 Tax=Amniculicola lignicola CBS 123094 TaxID=1392246 RepID=A0A6A5WNN0_9PLEO|nr:hypothetical protein P154DRAFT_431173 [Amniculicola lignicola CBS 123094]